MFKRTYELGFLMHPIHQGAPLSAIQYADDTLLLHVHGSTRQAIFAKQLLDAAITRLHIDFQKSTFVALHMSDQEANEVASILGSPITHLPCTYLGLPPSANKMSRKLLHLDTDRIGRRLPSRVLGSCLQGRGCRW
jgi:hypothetical protein